MRVVIAGGGTAGWVAAAALVKQLGALIEIVLVESDEIGTVGVGESTIPTAKGFHDLLGIDEAAFMRATGATFKLGIRFENWARDGDGYFHPFGATGRGTWMGDFQHYWLEGRRQGSAGELGEYSLEARAAAAGRFGLGAQPAPAYAYHLDATGYARFLRGLAEPAGVRRVEGRIAQVVLDPETGDIAALVLASGERIAGELFLDCTGFRSLLLGEALGAAFEDWSNWLSTDSALAVQTESVGPPVPYTRAIAHDAGWRWRIPLQTRVGNGLVFASAHLSVDQARARLLGLIEGAPLTEPRLIRYRTGHRPEAWTRNCVALGLASGFVEPLESTSIHLVQIAVTRLIQLFPFEGVRPAVRERFNTLSQAEWEGVRDFVILHYHATERDDSAFWRGCREMRVPDSLAARLDAWREEAIAWQEREDLFRVDSWVHVLLGQRRPPAAWHQAPRTVPAADLARAFTDLSARHARTVAALPTHEAFLRSYCPAGAVKQAALADA